MITTHTHLLNALIEKYELKSYLEIGVQSTAQNFDKINLPEHVKCSVDPDINAKAKFDCTSDEFFKVNHNTFDLIFIDGLHTAEQVQRDFENSLRCLNDNGFILIHDVLPENESGTLVPRVQRQWWGDVYKWAMNIGHYAGIGYKTFNIDNGCMLVWKDKGAVNLPWMGNNEWQDYLNHYKILMNVTNEVII